MLKKLKFPLTFVVTPKFEFSDTSKKVSWKNVLYASNLFRFLYSAMPPLFTYFYLNMNSKVKCAKWSTFNPNFL